MDAVGRRLRRLLQVDPSIQSESAANTEASYETLRELPPTALADDIQASLLKLADGIKEEGMDEEEVVRHIREDLEKGFARGQSGPRCV